MPCDGPKLVTATRRTEMVETACIRARLRLGGFNGHAADRYLVLIGRDQVSLTARPHFTAVAEDMGTAAKTHHDREQGRDEQEIDESSHRLSPSS